MTGPGADPKAASGLLAETKQMFLKQARPVGVWADLSIAEFALVFPGKGDNAPDAPLKDVYPEADRLALFACTIGAAITEHIRTLFDRHDYALGYVLDAVASAGADRLAGLVQNDYETQVGPHAGLALLRYSPGYCGWHVSGQGRLFNFLKPQDVGITLRESFLMEPLKSVSGVFVLGRREIHRFDNTFDFCSDCRNPSCRERLAAIAKE
jgi:hypothetical protein